MNIYKIPTKPETDEYFETLFQNRTIKVDKVVSYGIPSPENYWYDQVESEWVTVLEGYAEIEYCNGEKVNLLKGEYTLIPAHSRHRVSKVSNPCLWVTVKF